MIFDKNLFSGKQILVTGGSSGIGRAVAISLAELGGDIIILGRNTARLQETAAMIYQSSGRQASVASFDLGEVDCATQFFKEVLQLYGPIDACFHSAGEELLKPLKMTKGVDIDRMFKSNVNSAFAVARAFSTKGFAKPEGSLLIMSSVSGLTGQSAMALYGSCKSAITGLVKSAACEFAPMGLTINQIAAGGVNTEMHQRIVSRISEAAIGTYEGAHLLGVGSISDVVNPSIFLLSPGARWITGSTVIVDGGYTVR